MQTKERTVVELKSSVDEINNILVTIIQKQHGFKMDSVSVNAEGVVTFTGTKSKDMIAAELHQNGMNGNGHEKQGRGTKRAYAPRKHAGLTAFLRTQLAGGMKAHIDNLVEAASSNGFEANASLLEKYLKQGTMKRDVTEVNEDVYMLTEYFQKSHNREEPVSIAR